jgi:hypothetical protein
MVEDLSEPGVGSRSLDEVFSDSRVGRAKVSHDMGGIPDFSEAENQVLEKPKSVQNGKRNYDSPRAIVKRSDG